jgi:NAD-dependent dihydropyrimidine dehydrogenase PreA subunit
MVSVMVIGFGPNQRMAKSGACAGLANR